jgi:hypothetical protein
MYKKISKICFLGLILMSFLGNSVLAQGVFTAPVLPQFPFVTLTTNMIQGDATAIDNPLLLYDATNLVCSTNINALNTNQLGANSTWLNVDVALTSDSDVGDLSFATPVALVTYTNTGTAMAGTIAVDNYYNSSYVLNAAIRDNLNIFSYLRIATITLSYNVAGAITHAFTFNPPVTTQFVDAIVGDSAGDDATWQTRGFNQDIPTTNVTNGPAFQVDITIPEVMWFNEFPTSPFGAGTRLVGHYGISIYKLRCPTIIEVEFRRTDGTNFYDLTNQTTYANSPARFQLRYTREQVSDLLSFLFYYQADAGNFPQVIDMIGEFSTNTEYPNGAQVAYGTGQNNWYHEYRLKYTWIAENGGTAGISYTQWSTGAANTNLFDFTDESWRLYFSSQQSVFFDVNGNPSALQ